MPMRTRAEQPDTDERDCTCAYGSSFLGCHHDTQPSGSRILLRVGMASAGHNRQMAAGDTTVGFTLGRSSLCRFSVPLHLTPQDLGRPDPDRLCPTASGQSRYDETRTLKSPATEKGSTPISRTVLKELQPSDPAWRPFAASLGCGVARCSQTHPLLLHPVSGSSFDRLVHA